MKSAVLKTGLFLIFCRLCSAACAQDVPNKGIDIKGFSKNYYSLPFIDLDKDAKR